VAMIDLTFADFRGRVLVTRERVKFTDADPYGHPHPVVMSTW
jgi:hypothetical protein